MTKEQFLQTLENRLSGVPKEERKDILHDYLEHFEEAALDGRSEEETVRNLGDPVKLAKSHRMEYMIDRTENATQPDIRLASFLLLLLTFFGLSFFNLIVMIPVFVFLLTLLLGVWTIALMPLAIGAALLLGALHFIPLTLGSFIIEGLFAHLSVLFGGLGALGLGFLFLLAAVWITKGFFKAVVHYIKLNIKAIQPK